MRSFLFPIILAILAIGLFAMYTNPTYQRAKGVLASVNSYNDALSKSKELRKIRDEKIAAFNTFSPDNKTRLTQLLPDNVDNIRLIIDINGIAGRHNLALKNVSLGTISDSANARTALAAGASGEAVGSIEIGFSVATTYDNMLAFVADLEHSLRVLDLENIHFTVSDKGMSDYDFKIRTYWLH
jgi:hypothetical protein